MPFYDYQCEECKYIQEVLHPMSGPTEKVICEKCNSHKMARLVSVPYVKFVGEWQTNQVRGIDKL